MINRVYFADSEAAINNTKLFLGVNTMVLDFCSQMQNGITPATRETTKDGNYDILNLMWFTGPGSLFQNQSGKKISSSSWIPDSLIDFALVTTTSIDLYFPIDPRCAWSGVYLEPNQKSCVLCKTGFYWYKRACYVTCPSNTFLDSDSRSCQGKQFPTNFVN
mgnify:CR=1 FL=1